MWVAIAALIPVVVSLIGQAIADGDRAKAEKLRLDAAKQYNIPLPDLASFEKELPLSTELQKVVADPQYTEAANQALSKIGEYASGSGMTAEDLATLDEAKQAAGTYISGVQGANRQSMAARGISGSGLEMSNQEGAAATGVDRAYRGGIQAAADASRRRYAALQDQGNLASRLSQNDLAQKNLVGSAQDNINRFNWQQKVGAAQGTFDNASSLAGGKVAGAVGASNFYGNQAKNTADVATGIGQGLGQGAAAYALYEREQDALKGAGGGSGQPSAGTSRQGLSGAAEGADAAGQEGDDELGHYVLDADGNKIRK